MRRRKGGEKKSGIHTLLSKNGGSSAAREGQGEEEKDAAIPFLSLAALQRKGKNGGWGERGKGERRRSLIIPTAVEREERGNSRAPEGRGKDRKEVRSHSYL